MTELTTNAATAHVMLAPSELIDLAELRRLESVIDDSLDSWLSLGRALLEIYRRGLYKHSHSDFTDYVRSRWPDIGKSYAWRLISAADVVDDLTSPIGDVPVLPAPRAEYQARPLGALPKAQRREVWAAAVAEKGGGQPSGSRVAELAAKARKALGPERKLALQQKEEARLKRSAQERKALTQEQSRTKHLERARFLLRQAIRHLVAANGEADWGEPLELMRQAYLLAPFAE